MSHTTNTAHEQNNNNPTTQRDIKREFLLAVLPTITILIVLGGVEWLSQQRLLFASLASSAFLVYLDPHHKVNRARTLVLSQVGAALLGFGARSLWAPGYGAAAAAMVVVIVLMVWANAVHPPAVSTALGFGFRSGPDTNLFLFVVAVGVIVALVYLQRVMVRLVPHPIDQEMVPTPKTSHPGEGGS